MPVFAKQVFKGRFSAELFPFRGIFYLYFQYVQPGYYGDDYEEDAGEAEPSYGEGDDLNENFLPMDEKRASTQVLLDSRMGEQGEGDGDEWYYQYYDDDEGGGGEEEEEDQQGGPVGKSFTEKVKLNAKIVSPGHILDGTCSMLRETPTATRPDRWPSRTCPSPSKGCSPSQSRKRRRRRTRRRIW